MNSGGRFSTNARMPSFASLLRVTVPTWRCSIERASSSGSQPVSMTDAFEAATDSGPFAAITSAISTPGG